MTAKFLIRFDDICPTLNWGKWARVESVLNLHDVKPMLAVVPDNRDPKLMVDPPNPDFWALVREWQARGWTIGIHGYQHAYTTVHAGLVGLNRYSEFAGLPYADQKQKIENALAILSKENVAAQAWIAPAHSFDSTTVGILVEKGVRIISDGFYFRPVEKMGATWIPQQLWDFRNLRLGLWTVCFHPNDFSERSIIKLDRNLTAFRGAVISLSEVLLRYHPRPEGFLDAKFSKFWLWKLKRRIRKRRSRS